MRKAAIIILLFTGLSILLYPFASSWISHRRMLVRINSYNRCISSLDAETAEAEWLKAKLYNDTLRKNSEGSSHMQTSGNSLPSGYYQTLNIEGVMCVLEIPSISVNIPVSHGVSTSVLRNGAGHIEGTSLPIGGEGTHSFITAHTGLPEARLMTNLDKLKEGDIFYISVLNTKLVYKVDKIDIIEPQEIADYAKWESGDYVTLITCTPYGVNSHRLLVRGTRVQWHHYPPVYKNKDYICFYLLALLILILLISFIIVFLLYRKKDDKNEKRRVYRLKTPDDFKHKPFRHQ